MPAVAAAGKPITTLEGLASRYRALDGVADGERLHPVQQAFIDEQAMQCGYCIPGFIMTSVALLDRVHAPDRATIREALSQNMCRCGTYQRIVRAVERAAAPDGGAHV
jgi:nicotinate dehydrogenase subunit A